MNERDLQDMRDAYEPTDPKHPDYTDLVFDKADQDLKRLKEAGFEVYGWVPMEADE